MRYGLYLVKGNTLPEGEIIPVEGYLLLPGTKVIAVWSEVNYNGTTIQEVLPYNKESFDEKEADTILKRIMKRIEERIGWLKKLKEKEKENENHGNQYKSETTAKVTSPIKK